MGMQRFPSAAAASARLLQYLRTGFESNRNGIDHGWPMWRSYECFSYTSHSAATQEFSSLMLQDARLGRQVVSELRTAGAAVYSTFTQSDIQLAQQSIEGPSGRRRRLASQNVKTQRRPIVYECSECHAICVTRILKDPYDRGIVIVRCMDCSSVNLISDQLNLLQEPGSMKKFLKDKGFDFRSGAERVYEFTPEVLFGTDQQKSSAE